MLQSIEIENFRCFEKTAISGFEQINLITGKNNSGKTALLEALYLFIKGKIDLKTNSDELVKYLFHFEKVNREIKISGDLEDGNYILTYNYDRESKYIIPGNAFYGDETKKEVRLIWDSEKRNPSIKSKSAIELYDDIQIAGKGRFVVDAAQIIDNSIEEIRTFASRPNLMFIRKKDEESYMPAYFMGDATQKIITYNANLISFSESSDNAEKILLIDEIENGIHYTAQAEVWRMLMKLCKHYNIQLFATTHSLEMIKAFQQVCSEEEFTGMGGYFELGRSPRNQQIIGVKHNIDTLEYELATEATIRGE